jgi:anti-sigma B factor antagonist
MSHRCSGREERMLEDEAKVTGSALVVRVVGALDAETLPKIGHDVMSAVGSGNDVVLDAAELSFCDSHGIGLLIAAGAKARALGSLFVIRDLRPPIRHLLEITGLDHEIELLPKTSPPTG